VAFENMLLQNAWGCNFRRDVFLPLSEHSHVDLGLDNASNSVQGNAAEEI